MNKWLRASLEFLHPTEMILIAHRTKSSEFKFLSRSCSKTDKQIYSTSFVCWAYIMPDLHIEFKTFISDRFCNIVKTRNSSLTLKQENISPHPQQSFCMIILPYAWSEFYQLQTNSKLIEIFQNNCWKCTIF